MKYWKKKFEYDMIKHKKVERVIYLDNGEVRGVMTREQAKKKFPSYFENFEMPEWAREQDLEVFRACATGKIERESFLNSFEENGFQLEAGGRKDDPQQYSLSTYTKFKDVKRFMTINSKYGIPHVIAKGHTNPVHGICLETKEWKKHLGQKYRGSHVDWWLYESAEPFREFEVYDHEN